MKPNNKLTLLALCVIALNLRPALATLGPVVESLRAELQLSRGAVGLLTTLPVICMGAFAPLMPVLQARFGLRLAILLTTILLAVGTAVRAYPTYPSLLISSLIAGACIAVLGPLTSAFIKQQFSESGARITSWVTTSLCIGAAAGASLTAPLADRFGWSYGLASWSLLALLSAACWQWLVPRTHMKSNSMIAALPWRNAKAWRLMIVFGCHSMVFYCLLAWLAPAYHDEGLSVVRSGQLLGLFALLQIAGTLAVSALPQTQSDRRPALVACGALTLFGLVMMWRAPLAAPELGMCLLGAGTAGLFALTLILPLDYSRSAAEAGAWTALMCGGGYVLAGMGPSLAGWVRDTGGSYRQVFASLSIVSAIVLTLTLSLGPRKN